MALMQNIADVLTAWGEKLNYELIASTGDGDIDMYIQQMELYANQGVDGFLLNFDINSRFRIKEVADDIGIPYMSVLNTVRSEEGSCIIPCVTLDGYQLGLAMMDWLYANQETYWGAKPSAAEVGYIGVTWSQNKDLHDRYVASAAKFLEYYPGNDANVFSVDGVVGKMDAQTGSDLTAPVISGNPNIKYWYIVGVLEQYAQGAALAAEDLGVGKNTMVTTVNSDVLTGMWETGYDGCFVSCVAVSPAKYAAPAISALLAIIEGKATFDTLWTSRRAAGDTYTVYYMDTEIVTKDTYKPYFEEVKAVIDSTKW
jgi:ABC-type sugar transport system substrate-binding protein